jgi:glycosyltransferase involved in cell wall biosynthesis
MRTEVAIIVIGRNEGERLRACLESIAGKAAALLYVDSGSTDQSVTLAKQLEADVVSLDDKSSFTAARGRNAGFDRIRALAPQLEFVQFIDGDCQLSDTWLENAVAAMRSDTKLAAVCGRRRERFPQRSIYNAMMDLEWNRPAGLTKSVGGDALFRAAAFASVGGFNPGIAAGEEPELCLRLRQSGWTIRRLDSDMTWHDANLLSFGDWWQRQIRSGRGAMDVYNRTRDLARGGERLFAQMVTSTRRWTIGWLCSLLAITALVSAEFGLRLGLLAGLLVLLALPLQALRIALLATRNGTRFRLAIAHGFFTMLGKWAMLIGQMRCKRRTI